MGHIAPTQLGQIGNVRRIQFCNIIMTQIQHLNITQIFKLILFQRANGVAM